MRIIHDQKTKRRKKPATIEEFIATKEVIVEKPEAKEIKEEKAIKEPKKIKKEKQKVELNDIEKQLDEILSE